MDTFNITLEMDANWLPSQLVELLRDRLVGHGLTKLTVKRVINGEEADEAAWSNVD